MEEGHVAVLAGGGEVEVERPFAFGREVRQIVVMRRKKRGRAELVVDELRGRPGDRAAVGRGGAPAHLVEQHQRVGPRIVEDLRQFAHLAHERRLAAGDVVGGADAGEQPVEDGERGCLCGDERPGLCEDGRERDGPHVRRLAAHVRPRDHRDRPAREVDVVRDERLLGALDDRVPTALDLDASVRVVDDLRSDVVAVDRHGRQRSQRVELRERVREPLDPLGFGGDPIANVDEQLVLQGVGALGRPDDLLLALLERRRVVPLAVLQRLAAVVVVRDAVEVGVGHLDVVAVDLVVSDRQRVDPCSLALAGLQLRDPLAPLALRRPQGVEFVVESLPDHAAVGDLRRRVSRDRLVDQLADLDQLVEPIAEVAEVVRSGSVRGVGAVDVSIAVAVVVVHVLLPSCQRRLQFGNHREGRVQRAQVSRVGATAGDAPDEPFQVVGGRERVGDALADERAVGQFADRVVSASDRVGVDERPSKPSLQTPPAERTARLVEDVEQRVARAEPPVLEQLEAALGGRVEPEPVPGVVSPDPRDVREGAVVALRVLGVGEDRPRGAELGVGVEAAVGGGEVRLQPFGRGPPVEDGPIVLVGRPSAFGVRRLERGGVRSRDQLRGSDPVQFPGDRVSVARGDETLAGRDVDGGEADLMVRVVGRPVRRDRRDRRDVVRRAGLEEVVLDDGPRGDHLGDGAVDEPRRLLGVLDLIADRDAIPRVEQRFEVRGGVVDRDPGHRVVAGRVGPLRERHLTDPGDRRRGLTEGLVEVADLEQHERVLVSGTQVRVLREHRGELLADGGDTRREPGDRLAIRRWHITDPDARGHKPYGGTEPNRSNRRGRRIRARVAAVGGRLEGSTLPPAPRRLQRWGTDRHRDEPCDRRRHGRDVHRTDGAARRRRDRRLSGAVGRRHPLRRRLVLPLVPRHGAAEGPRSPRGGPSGAERARARTTARPHRREPSGRVSDCRDD